VQGVDVLPAGPLPLNPAELMESTQMRELIRWAEQHYDRVIIDTPPAAVVGDAIPLVTEVSGVLVVVRLGEGGRDAEHLCGQLLNIEAPLLGLVVNGARRRRSEYDYSHGAHAPFAESERPDVGAPAPTEERKRSGTRQRRTKRRHAEV
jgi:Mrp family chromosome partitioning ATPase